MTSPSPQDLFFLAPVTTGWLRNGRHERASVNIILRLDGNYFAYAVLVTPGHPRDRIRKEPLYCGAMPAAASHAADKALRFFTTHGYRASPPASSARPLDADKARVAAARGALASAAPASGALTSNVRKRAQPESASERRRRFWER